MSASTSIDLSRISFGHTECSYPMQAYVESRFEHVMFQNWKPIHHR